MNKLVFDIDKLPTRTLPIVSDDDARFRFKRWSFVNIYSLTALRDIYNLTKDTETKTVKSITIKVNENQIQKDIEKKFTPFTERQVLENLNALVKFDLLDEDYFIQQSCFENSPINSDLSNDDKCTLKNIFFNYFRFKELSSWFIKPTTEFHKHFEKLNKQDFIVKSTPLFYYSDESRFSNSFLTEIRNPNTKYIIENEVLMRFWDVYLKWGTELNILDKYNLSPVNSKLQGVTIVFFIRPFAEFDLVKFIKEKFETRYIWIPELILKITIEYRYSVNEIIKFIKKTISENDNLTYERTSEIFLVGGSTNSRKVKSATYLYPIIDDSYISTLILRK